MTQVTENKRQRAPSKRSLETRARIFDAAELVFAARGFEGASIRDIATAANVQKALVSFHGESKEALFAKVVFRRAEELADLRLTALDKLLASQTVQLRDILDCFIRPLLEKTNNEGAHWLAYARLIAQVSADPRWSEIAKTCFDPAAKRFIAAIAQQHPKADPQAVASCFVFTVSAMLSLCTSQWRFTVLGDLSTPPDQNILIRDLITFCDTGMRGVLCEDQGRQPRPNSPVSKA